MRETTIGYANLWKEMQCKGLSINRIAQCMDCNRNTVTARLARKTPLSLKDAAKIRDEYLPEFTMEYLFSEDMG